MRPKLMNAKKLPEMAQQQDSMGKPQTLEFVRAYYKITEPAVQKQIFELTKAAAKGRCILPDETMVPMRPANVHCGLPGTGVLSKPPARRGVLPRRHQHSE